MGGSGLVAFVKGFYPQFMKDGLIIDCRDNHGGFVSQMMIERLNRQIWAYDKPRRGRIGTYPDIAHAGYKCAVTADYGLNNGNSNPLALKRIHTEHNIAHFVKNTSGFEQFRNRFSYLGGVAGLAFDQSTNLWM